jgi:hypothetical protein
MKTRDPQREVIERADWMRLARRQSQTLAGSREGLQVPLRWDAPQEARSRAVSRSLRLSWALVLLPALILGGATGTWAFVRHLQLQEPTPTTEPAKPRLIPAPALAEKPLPRRTRRQALQPDPGVITKPDPAPRRAPRKAARVKKATPPPVAATTGTVIVIPTRVIGEDQVIIVSPPAKMKPLWSVESYKKGRGRAITPGR